MVALTLPTNMTPLTQVLINHTSRGNQSRMESGFEMSFLNTSLIGKGWNMRRMWELSLSPVHRSDSQTRKYRNAKDYSQRHPSLGRDRGACAWAKWSTCGCKVISILKQCSPPWVWGHVPGAHRKGLMEKKGCTSFHGLICNSGSRNYSVFPKLGH